MRLFKKKNNSAIPIDEENFKTEREIQKFVEENMKELLDLEFVMSEFSIDSCRIDSLGFDLKKRAFVIVEYKKDRNSAVIDQGLHYLNAMDNNQEIFILRYNEEKSKNKQLRLGDVDWDSSRVIFISPQFYDKQKIGAKSRFKKHFELWQIKKYEGGIVTLECIDSDKNSKTAKRSINTKRNISKKDHTKKLEGPFKSIWSSLEQELIKWPETSCSLTRGYISFKRNNVAVCYIYLRKKEIMININRGKETPKGKSKGFFNMNDPKGFAKENSWRWASENTGHEYKISLRKRRDLDYVLSLIRQKYESLGKK